VLGLTIPPSILAAPRSWNKAGLKINIWYAVLRGGLPAGQSGLTSIAIMLLREGALRYYECGCYDDKFGLDERK